VGELRDLEYRITPNRATDLIRRRRARVRTVGGVSHPEIGEEGLTDELSQSFDVASALSRLSPAHREVLTLAQLPRSLTERDLPPDEHTSRDRQEPEDGGFACPAQERAHGRG
jgi:hypothetical protein